MDKNFYENLWETDSEGFSQMDYFKFNGLCFTENNSRIDQNPGWTITVDQAFRTSQNPVKFSWFELELVELEYLEDAFIH